MDTEKDIKKLHSRSRLLLEFIVKYFQQNKFMPTLREMIGVGGMTSTSIITYHLTRLEKVGEIKRIHNVSRGIILLNYDIILQRHGIDWVSADWRFVFPPTITFIKD